MAGIFWMVGVGVRESRLHVPNDNYDGRTLMGLGKDKWVDCFVFSKTNSSYAWNDANCFTVAVSDAWKLSSKMLASVE